MENKKTLPKRKKNRLDNFDYGSDGIYFITICADNRKNIFWNTVDCTQIFPNPNVGAIIDRPQDFHSKSHKNCVGAITDCRKKIIYPYDETYLPKDVELSFYGTIVSKAIDNIPLYYPEISVDGYVIMPNHIHMLLKICSDKSGRSMIAPTNKLYDITDQSKNFTHIPITISRVVKQFKGCVSKQTGLNIWQKSFFDHIIRDEADYIKHLNYIRENPLRLQYDELYNDT